MINWSRHISISILLLFIGSKSFGQYYDFSFEHITTEDGLSNDVVNSIVKDKRGFMWFGTNDGLNRYDGRNFHVIRAEKNDTTGLPSNYISNISIDNEGWLWLTTGRGICRFDPEKNHFEMLVFPGNDRKTIQQLSNVAVGRDEHVWFISGAYLYKMHRRHQGYKRYPLPSIESYFNVHLDKKGRVWVYLRNAIYLFSEINGEFRYYEGLSSLQPNATVLMGPPVVSSSDTLFIASYGEGIYYFNEEADRFVKWKKSSHLVSIAVEDYMPDGRRFLWCLGGGTGLMIYDPGSDKFHVMVNNPRDPYSHNATDCSAIFKDPATNTVWIATKSGVEKYDPHSLRFKRKFLPSQIGYSSFALLGKVIQDMTDPSRDTYWIASWALGLVRWSRESNEFKVFDMKNGILHNEVFHISQSRFGYIIVASRDGITLFDPRTQRPLKKISDFMKWPLSRKVLYAMEDHAGNIWVVANYDGVFQYDIKTGKVRHWEFPGVIPEKGPFLKGTIQEDRNNRIWVSGFNGEIFQLDPATGEMRIINDRTRKGRKLNGAVATLMINPATNEIWASGTGNYLAELDIDGEVKRVFEEKDTEGGDGYSFLIQDPLGCIWASSENYVQRIDTKTGTRDYFGKEDGLVSSSGIHGSNITGDGELFLGFQYAFCHINTKNISFNTRPPTVAISSVRINYEPRYLDDPNEILLGPDERILNLEFAALNYSQPEKNRFAYKLDGYDTGWVFANDHDITLMNLEGGTHLLHVKASNNDGFWGKEMVMRIKVIPPFHKTIWFKLMIAVMLGMLAYLIIWYRKEQRKRLEHIRQRIATDLHDDMGSTLSSIRIFSDVAKKQVADVKPETVLLLDRISTNATSLSENMQDIIWTIRSDNDTLDDLVSRMREFGLRVCDARHILFKVHVSQNFKTSKLSLEQRRNIYLIFKEVINNAVKYSESTLIELFLTQQGRYLKMEISDNGKGFDMEKVKRGNGLNNLEKRAKEINGTIDINTSPGKGTRVGLMMVLKKKDKLMS